MSIYVIEASNLGLVLAVEILHLLPCAVPAGMDAFELEPPQNSGAEVVDEQCAWYVGVCVRAGYGE